MDVRYGATSIEGEFKPWKFCPICGAKRPDEPKKEKFEKMV